MSAQLAKVLGQVVLYRGRTSPAGYVVDELPNLWLFQNSAGEPIDYSKIRKIFTKLLAKSGLAQRNLHYLRHTFASLLLQQGESLKYVQEQHGHSTIKMTCDTYGHLVPGGNRQAVDRLDDGNRMETFWIREAYRRTASYGKYWSHPPESNRRPTDYESLFKLTSVEALQENPSISRQAA